MAPNVKRYLLRGFEGPDDKRLTYSSDLRSYAVYCELYKFVPWFTTLETLASYAAHPAHVGRKTATINWHLATTITPTKLASQSNSFSKNKAKQKT